MGAEEFYSEGKGKTAQEAFNSLVDAATYYNGHGGYTGTIAEKDGFQMLNVEREAERAIERLQELLPCYTVKEQKRLQKQLKSVGDNWELADRIEARMVYAYRDETLGQACTRKRKQIRASIKKLKTKKARASAVADALMEADDRRTGKWAPACCIQLTHRKRGTNEFLFFGWASC